MYARMRDSRLSPLGNLQFLDSSTRSRWIPEVLKVGHLNSQPCCLDLSHIPLSLKDNFMHTQ